MKIKNNILSALFLSLACISLFIVGINRLQLDNDILNSLPQEADSINTAKKIFTNHPMQNVAVFDLHLAKNDKDLLHQNAEKITKKTARIWIVYLCWTR